MHERAPALSPRSRSLFLTQLPTNLPPPFFLSHRIASNPIHRRYSSTKVPYLCSFPSRIGSLRRILVNPSHSVAALGRSSTFLAAQREPSSQGFLCGH
jgi:hypothetical protein